MPADRRTFLKCLGGVLAAGGAGAAACARAASHGHSPMPADPMGVLVDLTACVGCRLCEYACRQANGLETGPLAAYDDTSVFARKRRPAPDNLTVINAWSAPSASTPVHAKVNCVHCNDPACVSACIVGALEKQEDGAVTYDAWKCIGCRYCMVACPMQLPAYEYADAFTPEIRKCQLCHHRTIAGQLPACVEVCPQQVMIYGKRDQLIARAHASIREHPGRYVDHVYGEHEVGGTSWLYLSPVPFDEAGFLTLGSTAPPRLTEAIQHGVFKYWIAPVAWYGFLASMMWYTGRRARAGAGVAVPDQAQDERHIHASRLEHAGMADGYAFTDGGGAVAIAAPPITRTLRGSVASHQARRGRGGRHAEPGHVHPAQPVGGRLLTPGVWALIATVVVGAGFALYRFLFGLEAATHLDQQHPWGLWIAMDVGSGIALAGGGFVTAALVHIFHREYYHTVARSALLTALLGYTFYVPGLLADLGRWYNLWHPTLPSMWQVNSVLFEVGICVMLYLNVQYAEFAPILCERLLDDQRSYRFPRLRLGLGRIRGVLEFVMPALLVLGVTLSTFHQSSLGNLMVIAPGKLHSLWWTPVSPLLFLLSAVMVGFPMVIFTILFASRSLRREPEMHVLAPLARYIPVFLGIYLAVRGGDVLVRGVWATLLTDPYHAALWTAEVGLGVLTPMVMLLRPRVRRSQRWLAIACLMVIFGVVLNRLNVFVLAYHPPYAERSYIPSIPEFAVSAGLVAALMLVYRIAVTYLPILEPRPVRRGSSTATTRASDVRNLP